MKLTLDSTESLEDAMRVVGALYGVTLVVATDEAAGRPSAKESANALGRRRRTARKRQSAERAASAGAAASAEEIQPAQEAPSRASGSGSNSEIRSWARENGLTVSDRGRVPATVIAAYRSAHPE
jgi:hypothetical protein